LEDSDVSIELPEAKILAEQMNKELVGKRVRAYMLKGHERLQRIGFLNKDQQDFERLVGGAVESVVSRGNSIRVKFDSGMNLLLAPEYGGEIFYHKSQATVPEEFHLRIDFDDGTALTVKIASMGAILALKDDELARSYMFRRDFNPGVPSPADEGFTYERFSILLADTNRALKSALVGKDAVVVGLSNSTFQDVLYRAKLNPKRKASELSAGERRALYDAVRFVVNERLRLNGKDQFLDLYGRRGRYSPAMGSSMRGRECGECGSPIKEISHGGGRVFICPKCQA